MQASALNGKVTRNGLWESTPAKPASVYECFSSGRITPNARFEAKKQVVCFERAK